MESNNSHDFAFLPSHQDAESVSRCSETALCANTCNIFFQYNWRVARLLLCTSNVLVMALYNNKRAKGVLFNKKIHEYSFFGPLEHEISDYGICSVQCGHRSLSACSTLQWPLFIDIISCVLHIADFNQLRTQFTSSAVAISAVNLVFWAMQRIDHPQVTPPIENFFGSVCLDSLNC